jgi:hypothetical protein
MSMTGTSREATLPLPSARARRLSPTVERLAQRTILAGAVGLVATILALEGQASVLDNTDFAQVWHAARGLLAGDNPYDIVGPGRPFPWPFPLLYPATAVLVGTPFALLTLRWASALFVGFAAGALAWALSARQDMPSRWLVFASAGYASVVRTAQWAPLLMASALTPSLGWFLACKPTIGMALLFAYPSRLSAGLAAAFAAISLVWLPGWPADWLEALPSASHMSAPVTHLTAGGPLILLALCRWRVPEARLLVGLGCVPHTTMLYETLPLFLIPRRWHESILLVVCSWVCLSREREMEYLQLMHLRAWWITLLLYLPCLVMILSRSPQANGQANSAPHRP